MAGVGKRKLPVGIQTFREIREEGYYYVDKTVGRLDLAVLLEGNAYLIENPPDGGPGQPADAALTVAARFRSACRP